MMNLAEYRRTATRLADFLPWVALVGEGVVLNKDGSFQRSARFRGPDLDSAVAAELVAVASRLNNAFRRLGSGWAIFVEAQRHEAGSYPASRFADAASALVDAERKADFEEADAHYESSTARTSRVFFQTEARVAAPIATVGGPGSPSLSGLGLPGQPGAATAQDRQLAFLNAGVDRRTVSPDRVMGPASPYVLQTGAVIAAALITGIRSDLPGQITAQVTEHVYDSPTGRILLVPQGTRLIGEYSNDVGFGQRRVLLVWKRLILPNGRSIVLERQPGADAQGYAGLQDGVDYHWWDLAKAAGLSTLLSVGAELAVDDQDRLLRAIRNGGQDAINDAGQQIIRRQLNVAPTLTIRPGFPVRVIVTRDLVLEPYGGL